MGNKGELYLNVHLSALCPVAFVPFQLGHQKLTSGYSLCSSYSMKMESAGFMMSRY